MIFTNRQEAGKELAKKLARYKGEDVVIIALPKGGVPVGFEIAKVLQAPLDVLVVRKIGAPGHPEFGIGAIAPEGVKVLDRQVIESLGLDETEIEIVEKAEQAELQRRIQKYRGHNSLPHVEDKTVILVDDGLATGVTLRAAIEAARLKKPKKIVIAIPVCAFDSVESLKHDIQEVESIECLIIPFDFTAVGVWYREFPQVTDEEVVTLLKKSKEL